MVFKSKVKNKVLSGQSREIISAVMQFMTREAAENAPVIPLSKVLERLHIATGVSIRTLARIKREKQQVDNGEQSQYATPNKKRSGKNRKKTIALDDADTGILRRTIHNLHVTEKQVPTLRKIHHKFVEDTGYQGGRESLRTTMRKIGFRWKKMRNNRKILMERHEIRHLRIEFLKQMREYRAAGRPIVYMDETYIHAGHTKSNGWCDDTNEGLHKNISKGEMLIVLHAGGENGFVPGTYARWKSTCNTGDYHNSMNYENYEKWVRTQLVPNLLPNSVVVIDNAPYHNKQQDKCPTSASTKRAMQDWLRSKNIAYSNDMLKPQLYQLVLMYKPRYKTFKIDKLFHDAGHDVLRLPPYHPDLNPIELVWAAMKEYVGARNIKFNLTEVTKLCDEFFGQFSVEQWVSRCERAKRFELEFMEREPMIDVVVDELIININNDSDDVTSSDDNADYDDDDDYGNDFGDEALSGIEELPQQELQ